jgi:hypothetical protein
MSIKLNASLSPNYNVSIATQYNASYIDGRWVVQTPRILRPIAIGDAVTGFTVGKFLIVGAGGVLSEGVASGSSSVWGGVTGTLADQTDLQTALNLKANLASPTFTGTVAGITKAMVGLTSVDDTSDASKPVSTAQQTALNLKANLASPTFTGTVAGITTAMVTEATDANYVSDAELVIIGNTSGANTGDNATNTQYSGLAASKQATLVSATNIKSVNGSSLLGAGDLSVGAVWGGLTGTLADQTDLQTALDLKAPLASPTFTGLLTGAKTLLTSALVTDVTLQLKAAIGTQSVNILELLDAAGSVMSRFDQTGQLSVGGIANSAGYNIAGNGLYVSRYSRSCYYGSSFWQFTSGNYDIYDASAARWTFKNGGVMNFANMPTSSAGLATGDLWSNSGVITIV